MLWKHRSMTLVVRLATARDVPGIAELETRNYIGNLDPADTGDGFISVLHSPEWFSRCVDSGEVHVAANEDDTVAGFIVITAAPDPASAGLPPIVQTMLELAETLEVNGKPIARHRFALRGPVCIDKTARGRGVYSAFNSVTRRAYRDRFDLGVLFVAAGNPRSLHTTTTKLGAHPLAEFQAEGRRYHFLAYEFGDGGEALASSS
jgi:hypothetical protein